MTKREIRPEARKRLNRLSITAAEAFDEPVVHNRVAENVPEDDTLRFLLDLTEGAHTLSSDVADDEAITRSAFDAAETLNDEIDRRVATIVAETCQTVIDQADVWVERGWLDEQDARDARHEAREWLQLHLDAAERVGAIEPVGT